MHFNVVKERLQLPAQAAKCERRSITFVLHNLEDEKHENISLDFGGIKHVRIEAELLQVSLGKHSFCSRFEIYKICAHLHISQNG